jgi:hypothetical protein
MPDRVMFQPHALERLTQTSRDVVTLVSVDEAYAYVREVAKRLGASLPEARPTVQQASSWKETEDRIRDQAAGHREAWNDELAQLTAVVSAIRLAAVPIIDPLEKLKVIEALLAAAPPTPEGDRLGPALLVDAIQSGRMKAQLVPNA